MGTLTIGKNKKRKPAVNVRSMLAMPTPTGWGDKAQPARQRGNMRLEKGEIAFERINVRLFVDRPVLPEPLEDRVIEQMGADTRRPVLPVVEQSPYPEPPDFRASPYRHVDEEISDYTRPGDSDAICSELREQIRTISFRMLVCTISVLFLGSIELLPEFGVTLPDMFMPDKAPLIYLGFNLFFLIFCGALCCNIIFGGIKNLAAKRIDGEALLSLGYCAVVLQTAAQTVACLIERQPVCGVCGAPAIAALLLNDLGLLMMVRRVARNFRFVALKGVRRAARIVGDGMEFDEILHADRNTHSRVTYTVRAKFLAGYLRFAYEEDYCEQQLARIAPYVLPAALASGIIGGIAGFGEWGVWGGISCFCTAITAGIPVCRLFCLNLPLERASKQLTRRGVMLNGWAAVDEFGGTDTLAVNSDALFPEGTVRLLSVKAFGEAPIDRSILYAASVVMASGGPLAQVFYSLLEERAQKLLPADGIGYENEMGVSGWVESLPVLVGNRSMLERHNVELPSRDYEQIIKNGKNRHLVYIAISGRPCAVMLVQYRADPDTADAVREMVSNGVNLVVYTTDANVTGELVSEIYGIPSRHVTMLSVRAGSEYDRLTHTILDRAPAVLCTVGRLSALADGISAAKRLRSMLRFNTLLQLVCFGLCVLLTVGLSFFSGCEAVSPGQVMLMQLMCLAVSLVSMLRRPL